MRMPRGRVQRRRLAALAVVALVAGAIGIAVGSSGDSADEPKAGATERRAALDLPLEQQVGELLVMSFPGPTAPEYIRRRLRNGEGSGVILFGPNVTDARGLRRLTRSLQRAARGDALIATDQEGGEIRNVPFAGPLAPQSAVATVDAAAATGREAASGLRRAGVNVNLAPVADVNPATGRGVLASRIYPGAPGTVGELVAASVRAHSQQRVAATVKHFPGLGRATINTDDGSTAIPARQPAIQATDLVPFRAAIEAGAPLIMASHALYPAFDARRIASQSPTILRTLLRDRLGFGGAVVTDSVEAQAVLDRSDVGTAAVRSVVAGADLVLMTGSGSWNLVYPRLLRRARRSPAFRTRVEESARRVIELKRRLGLRAAG